MPTHEEELDPGFLTRHLSSPWVSLPFALASGFGAAATPGSARLTRGLHTGLQLGIGAEEGAYKRAKEKRLSEALQGFIGGAPQGGTRQFAPLTSADRTKLATIPDEEYQKMTSPQVQALLGEGKQKEFEKLPDPAQYKGKALRGTGPDAGQAYHSDGTKWIPVDPSTGAQLSSDPRAYLPPGVREYLGKIAPYDPEGANRMLGTYLTREPPSPHFATGASGEIIAIEPRTLKPTTVVPGTKLPTYEEAIKQIPGELPEGTSATVEFGKGGKVTKKGPEEVKIPPSLDDNLVDQGLADLAAGKPISRRVMQAFGTSDPEDVKSRLLARNQIRQERKLQEKNDAMDIALVKTRAELAMQPMQGMVLDAKSGEVVNITKGDFAQNPKSYIRLTSGQERMKGGLDTATTHMVVTSKFIDQLPKSGLRITNYLGQKISQLENDPNAVALFQQLGAMTSLAAGSALVSGGGGRPGVRLAQFMAPAGVLEGDTFAVAITKMQNWMEIVSRNAKEAGLPTAPYDQVSDKIKSDVMKGLIRETGSVEKAKQAAKQYGLRF